MAYEKKTVQEYIAETDDKTVEGFNDNQETRIKAGFDNITKPFHFDYVASTPFEDIFLNNIASFPDKTFVFGTIKRGSVWTFTGSKNTNNYGSFLIVGYDGIYRVRIFGGVGNTQEIILG